jgi:solute carrier family 25 (mitochondrial aspartate/glutamate transporter), member 12/13
LNEKVIKVEDFIEKYLGLVPDDTVDGRKKDQKTIKVLANLVDLNKDGYVAYDEFKIFEGLLCSSDALFRCAFQLFDDKGVGYVSFDSFSQIMKHTELNKLIPFDFDCDFIKMTFGNDKKKLLNYQEFTQIIHVSSYSSIK